MEYQAPFGSTDPDAPYVDRNTPGAVAGSKVPAAAIEDPQRELDYLIAQAGITPSEADLTQVWQAILSLIVSHSTGKFVRVTGDTMTGTLGVPFLSVNDGVNGQIDINGNTMEIAGPGQSIDFKDVPEQDYLVRIGRNGYRLKISTFGGNDDGDIIVSSDHAAAGNRGVIALAPDAADAANGTEAVTPAGARSAYVRKSGEAMTGPLSAPGFTAGVAGGVNIAIGNDTLEMSGANNAIDFKNADSEDFLVRLTRNGYRLRILTANGTEQGNLVVDNDLATTEKAGLIRRATSAEVADRAGANAVGPQDLPRSESVLFSAPGTYPWVVPAGVRVILAEVWGGGGGGGAGGSATSAGSGGGGGGYALGRFVVTPGQTIYVVVGGGGAGGVANVSAPTAGGTSSMAGALVATGGGPGTSIGTGAETTNNGDAGAGSGGSIALSGARGSNGIEFSTTTYMGGFGGSTHTTAPSGPNVNAPGLPGHFPGGGGSGASANAAGGNGANGLVIIKY